MWSEIWPGKDSRDGLMTKGQGGAPPFRIEGRNFLPWEN
jgi:hypothetical protein